MRLYKITVEGSGQFPIDMLRRDMCFPHSESDALLMGVTSTEAVHRVVNLLTWRERCPTDHVATNARWESFGWEVFSVEIIR